MRTSLLKLNVIVMVMFASNWGKTTNPLKEWPAIPGFVPSQRSFVANVNSKSSESPLRVWFVDPKVNAVKSKLTTAA
jgi:hypothetical protein